MVRKKRTIFLYMLITAILFRLLSNPLANVFQKKLIKSGVGLGYVNFFTYFALACASVSVFFVCEISFSFEFWFCCLFGGFLGAISNFCLVKALSLSDLSVLGPVNSYKSVVGVFFGIILLNEYPSLWGVFGIALIVFGSYFLTEKASGKFSFSLFREQGVRYRFYALFLSALESIFIKKVVLLSSVEVGFASWACFGGLFSLLFVKSGGMQQKISFAYTLPRILAIALFVGIMQYSTNFVFARMNVGYALALFQLSGMLSVIFGFLFFSEKNIFRKLVASIIMCIGAGIILINF